ncbi:hypothetical protein KIPB_016962, partial [Kipferlia bialata]|eukprot:g16962.t1
MPALTPSLPLATCTEPSCCANCATFCEGRCGMTLGTTVSEGARGTREPSVEASEQCLACEGVCECTTDAALTAMGQTGLVAHLGQLG